MKKIFLLFSVLFFLLLTGCDLVDINIVKSNEKTEETEKNEEETDEVLTIRKVINTDINEKIITRGTVVAKNDYGFIIKDSASYIFINFNDSIENITIGKTVKVVGKHIFENGHKIEPTKVSNTTKEKITESITQIDDFTLNNYKNFFKKQTHVLNYVMLDVSTIYSKATNTICLITKENTITAKGNVDIEQQLNNYINKTCTLVGYLYEYDGHSFSILLTDVLPSENNIEILDPEFPNIITNSNYYHFLTVEDLGNVNNLFEVYDEQDGNIIVTKEMITGDVYEGINEVSCKVMDSDGNISTKTIIVEIGGYKGANTSNESAAILDINAMPSIGEAKVLVIPVNIGTKYDATEAMRTKIKKAFFGTEKDTGWESLTTYYEKSSYGKLHISGEVTPWYNAKNTQAYYAEYEDNDDYIYGSTLIMNEALEYFKNTYDYSDFDANNDGYIDAVYMIYNAPICGNGTKIQETFYWAYQYWDLYCDERTYQKTKGYAYVFTGYDFLMENLPVTNSKLNINCQTIIHETGHLLNLDDYYDYDDTDRYDNDGGYGYSDMMDANFGDHGPLSKILLNWVDPIEITKSGIYELPSFTTTGITFIIDANGEFETIFDEYYIIDFFTFDGVNKLQNPEFYKTDRGYAGVRISLANTNLTYEDDYYPTFTYNNTNTKHKLVQMLEADYNGKLHLSSSLNTGATLDDFYQEGDIFGNDEYKTYKCSTGEYIPFTMEVLSMNQDFATVKITLK